MAAVSGGAGIEKRRERALALLEEAHRMGALPPSSFDESGMRRQVSIETDRKDLSMSGTFSSSGSRSMGGRSKSMVLPKATSPNDSLGGRRNKAQASHMRNSSSGRNMPLPPISPGKSKRVSVGSGQDATFYRESPARRSLLGESLARRHFGDEEEKDEGNKEEADAWLTGVLASMPGSTKRKSALLPSLSSTGEVGDSKAAQPEGSATPQANATAEEQVKTEGTAPEDARKADRDVKIDPNAVPEAGEVIKRYTEGFSASDISRMRSTFNRFKVPDTVDVHKDDLEMILKRLGYMMVEEEKLRQIADDVTIYSTLDFNEFVVLAERFNKYETGQFKEMFDKYDEDKSGQLSVEEVETLMASLGFTPLRKTVKEALDVVDKDKTGSLSFEEFTHLLAIYRSTEGFTRSEVTEFTKIFQKECCEEGEEFKLCNGKLPAKKLADVLLRFYGPNSLEKCKKLGSEVLTGSRKDAEEGEHGPPVDIHVPEALIWSRRLWEMEVDSFRNEFTKQDADGSGYIDPTELQSVISNLGFTLTKANIAELVQEADEDQTDETLGKPPQAKDGKLDFDEFVNLMMIFRSTDGFTKVEVDDMKNTFDRFDDNGNGEIDCLELSDMLRYMGYLTKLDDVHLLIATVDFNQSGSLDFREFLRLMRLHREHDMQKVKEVFEKMKDDKENMLPGFSIVPALGELGYKDPNGPDLSKTARRGSATEMKYPAESAWTDFDAFVGIVDKQRAVRVAQGRRRAGFSTQEIDKFTRLFASYDSDSSGVIDPREVADLLNDLGYKLSTKEEQANVMEQLDKARTAATAVGVEDVGAPGGSVSFWVFVQLLRVLYNRDDKRVLDREAHAAEQSRFSTGEIEEFREVFMGCWARDKVFEDETAANQPGVAAAEETEPDMKELSKDGMRRLLRSLGCALNSDQRQELEARIVELGTPTGRVDFATFLRLMRWMLDCNFADINKAAAKATGR